MDKYSEPVSTSGVLCLAVSLIYCVGLGSCSTAAPGGPTQAAFAPAPAGCRQVKGKEYQGVVAPDAIGLSHVLGKDVRRWSPADSDIARAEAALPAALAQDRDAKDIAEKLPSYQRQYFGFLEGTKKRIFINAFCTNPEGQCEWAVEFADGGACYFQAMYDVETNVIVQIMVNGEA